MLFPFFLLACSQAYESKPDASGWSYLQNGNLPDSTYTAGTTYLSVYSHIYSQTEHRTHQLTATVSIRNTNEFDTIYLLRADYFDTKGQLIRSYLKQTAFLMPLETKEIIISEKDESGGSGANFLFEWNRAEMASDPLFEAIMISTSGQQGLSFSTQGVKIH